MCLFAWSLKCLAASQIRGCLVVARNLPSVEELKTIFTIIRPGKSDPPRNSSEFNLESSVFWTCDAGDIVEGSRR
ncbi:hypothetical protein BDN70DRAFT_55057 [Pholiota conissans]|uniref:Secreted protein n=1 Tax=Pholiota conissans TaxID=109636 RepID=A0A9P5ZCS7_9AGAR|nr:hypothetical protein BDN70DRAFT_55057 [Pholiota conissans]